MQSLDNNWITEGIQDFEYKKYLLLAYLQHCKSAFTETKLYPPLTELVSHYHNLLQLRQGVDSIRNNFPKDISGFNISKNTFNYTSRMADDHSISTITEIVDFALPSLKTTLDEGKEIYEYVENNIELQPIGLLPVYREEGYLMLNQLSVSDVHIYQYKFSIVTQSDERYRSLSLQYLYRDKKSLSNTFESIKLNLTKRFKELPNPAAFLCLSNLNIPLDETLLPVTKRLFIKTLSGHIA